MSIAAGEVIQLDPKTPRPARHPSYGDLKRKPSVMIGAVVLLAFIALALFAPTIAPYDPNEAIAAPGAESAGPSADHLLGLDEEGRDVFSRVVFGLRLPLLVAFSSTFLAVVVGTLLGYVARMIGDRGAVPIAALNLIRLIPTFLLAVAVVVALGQGLWQIIVAVAIGHVAVVARLARGAVDREILDSLPPIGAYAASAAAAAMIEVAALGFVTLGPHREELPEWGRMIADNVAHMDASFHLILFPGLAIVLSAGAVNMIAAGLRDVIDPRAREL